MNANQIVSQVIAWLKTAIAAMLLLSIAVVLVKMFGVTLPIRTIGHVELAYLAGAYWLTR